jgi:hypothetical protein
VIVNFTSVVRCDSSNSPVPGKIPDQVKHGTQVRDGVESRGASLQLPPRAPPTEVVRASQADAFCAGLEMDVDNANHAKAACRPVIQWIAIPAILAIASITGYHLGWKSHVAVRDILVVEPSALDFGDVLEQGNFVWTIQIHNTTDREVAIDSFRSSCRCASIEPGSLAIQPRTARSVDVKIDLTSPRPAKLDDTAAHAFNVTLFALLAPVDGELARTLQWPLRGRVRNVVSFSPSVVDFENSLVLGNDHQSRTVVATAHVPIDRLEADFAQSGFAVQISKDPENPAVFSLKVLPPPGIPAGSFAHTLHVTPILNNGTRGPRTTLPIVGRVTSDIQLLPPGLVFGRVPIGAKLTDTVLVRSKAGKTVVITAQPVVDALPLEIVKISDSQFRLSFEAAMTGSQSQDIAFRVYYPDDDISNVIKLRISYFGVNDAGPNGVQQD